MNLRRAVGLVAAREAAGDHDDLASRMPRAQAASVLSATAVGREVVDHEDVGLGAGVHGRRGRVSYSQLLPGNTGMITRGRAILAPRVHVDIAWHRKSMVLDLGCVSPALR